MPITSSALKALRQAKKRTEHNRTVKSRAKSAIDAVKKTPSSETLAQAFSAIDRAVKNHIFHKNKAARLKSQLAKAMAKSGAPKVAAKPAAVKKAAPKAAVKAAPKKSSRTKAKAAKKS
ncbi:MAG TPA: 30S ribosomal protein S20 [Candidatus Saccharimonadia bacterium]|nr:30S ribosomal protein S20 [Candidatus Saccharimonadia bacterium]